MIRFAQLPTVAIALPPALPLMGVVFSALLLAGCSKATPDKDSTGVASGEVLQGSVSDAMIPYDQLRSQPPFEQVTPDAAGEPGTASPPTEATPSAQDTDGPAEPAAPGPAPAAPSAGVR